MIPQKIQALFYFIDFLDESKSEFVKRYLPLCDELNELDAERAGLKPDQNYIDKLRYDKIQDQMSLKFKPIEQNIYLPILNKLQELEIWSGDDVFTSIWNRNIADISDFNRNFTLDDVPQVMQYKDKYLLFRTETNSDFLCLQFIFSNLDEILKVLFDFFKDTKENEFDSFETKTVKVSNIENALETLKSSKGKNVRFAFPDDYLFGRSVEPVIKSNLININKVIMGDHFQVGDIKNHSGKVAIGKYINISATNDGKNETADKISELIKLIIKEHNIGDEQKQLLIANFDKIKGELLEEQPAKSKIFKCLSNTKKVLEKLVLSKDMTDALIWVYQNFNFIVDQFN